MQAHDRKNPVYLQPFTKSTPPALRSFWNNSVAGKRMTIPTATAQNWPSLTATFSEIWQSLAATFSKNWPSRTDYSPKTANNSAI